MFLQPPPVWVLLCLRSDQSSLPQWWASVATMSSVYKICLLNCIVVCGGCMYVYVSLNLLCCHGDLMKGVYFGKWVQERTLHFQTPNTLPALPHSIPSSAPGNIILTRFIVRVTHFQVRLLLFMEDVLLQVVFRHWCRCRVYITICRRGYQSTTTL